MLEKIGIVTIASVFGALVGLLLFVILSGIMVAIQNMLNSGWTHQMVIGTILVGGGVILGLVAGVKAALEL